MVLMILVAAGGPLWPGTWHTNAVRIAAWACFLLGAFFGVGGMLVLGRNRTIFPKPNAESRLVQEGVYRWVRHPLYTSVTLLSAGWGLLWASGPALLAGLVLAVFLNFKALREERWLVAKFPGYAAYRQQVKRLIPGVY